VKAVLAMSDDMKADLISAGCPEEKIIVHYYGIEAEQFSIQREDTQKDVIKFLIISGLHPKKGHTYLIEAFAAMSRSIEKNVELHIVGAGPLYPSLEEAISKTGLSNIFLHGHVNYGSEKHREYLREADVFVHPSVTSPTGDKEGIPGAVIEAMASGLPVITTYHAGIPSVVQDDVHALLVKEKDVMALQMAMTRLANDPVYRARIARDGQKHASTKLDVIPKEIELEEIYDLISINNKTLKANTIA
jgi:colanic acid/amylovoran biosynthesis glycosyltransferase